MSTIKVKWCASSKLMKREIVESGERIQENREFELDMTTLTPKQRKPIVEYVGLSGILDMRRSVKFRPTAGYNDYLDHYTALYLDTEPIVADILAFTTNASGEKVKAGAEKERVEAEKAAEKEQIAKLTEEWQPRLDALIEAHDLSGLDAFHAPPELTAINYQANKAWRELKQARQEADKEIWIKYHASAHLKRAVAAGYDCQREYVLQRAAREAPDACKSLQVDFNNTASWQSRCCPSTEALDIADAMRKQFGNAIVVWLTDVPSSDVKRNDYEDYYDEPFTPCEAIVSRDYLDKYDLVQIV